MIAFIMSVGEEVCVVMMMIFNFFIIIYITIRLFARVRGYKHIFHPH
jgi:hypothetical protein